MNKKAFIFDMNGTMIDDMKYHTDIWFKLLNEELGKHMDYSEVKKHMYGTNRDLLIRIFGENKFSEEEIERISWNKEKQYQHVFKNYLQLIEGLSEFLEKAKSKNIKMAIGTAAIPFNVDFVVKNLQIEKYFLGIVSADDVQFAKPHPEVFIKAAELLQIPAKECVVFEDAPKGVEAALNAGMEAVVILSAHRAEEFSSYSNVIGCVKDYHDPFLQTLF